MKRLKNYIQSNYRLFSTRTNMHGFGELYISKSFHGKLFWIFVLTSCLAITTYQVKKAVDAYVNEPYITVIGKITDDEILYPRLRLCYNHWIYWVDYEKSQALNFTKQSTLFGLSFLSDIYAEEQFNIETAKEEFFASMAANNFSLISKFYKAIAKSAPNPYLAEIEFFAGCLCYTMKDMNKLVESQRERAQNRQKEKTSIFLEIADKDVKGMTEGLLTRQEHDCYIARSLTTSRYKLRDEFVDGNLSSSFDIPPQLPTFLFIEMDVVEIRWDDIMVLIHSHATVNKWQNKENAPCAKDVVSFLSDYSCRWSCYQKAMDEYCLCSWFKDLRSMGSDFPETLCTSKIHFLTSSKVRCGSTLNEKRRRQSYVVKSLDCTLDESSCCVEQNGTKDCLKNCLSGCTTWNYFLGYVQRFKVGSLRNMITKNSFHLFIDFASSNEILSTSEIDNVSFERFVGNIGGLLGLWTGASILSIFQFFYLCCCGEFGWCTKRNIQRDDTRFSDIRQSEELVLD